MTVSTILKRFGGQKIYYKPNQGNGGDALIAAGAFKLFDTHKLNVEIITSDDYSNLKDQIVLYAGGGNLVKEYNNCAKFIKAIHKDVKELIILPHTVNGHEELLNSLANNVTIFCREEVSFENLKKSKHKYNLYLDQDLAFYIDPKGYNLTKSFTKSNLLGLRHNLKNILSRSDRSVLNAFRVDVEKTDIPLPKNNIDVSIKINHTDKMFPRELVEKSTRDIFQFLSKYRKVNTNRLHIAIACALLGIEANMYGNSYYKNEAIFNYSLKNKYGSVKFCK